jgi:AraC family transcriptional regulator, regulatory protein of adaptative response / methylated-DNA-[protein]-cysteine methyltransferase
MVSRQKKFYAGMFAKPVRKKAPPKRKDVFIYATGKSPLGPTLVALSPHGLVAVMIEKKASNLLPSLQKSFPKAILRKDDEEAREMLGRVIKHIEKPRAKIDLPLDMRGTLFQRRVWEAVRTVPPGKTASYSEIAEKVNAPRAVRAVGSTCTKSPMAYVIPCHRILHKGATAVKDKNASPRKNRFLMWDEKVKSGH